MGNTHCYGSKSQKLKAEEIKEEEQIVIPAIEDSLTKHIHILKELENCKSTKDDQTVICKQFLCPIYNGFVDYTIRVPQTRGTQTLVYKLARMTSGDLYGQDEMGDLFIDVTQFEKEMRAINPNLVLPNKTGTIVLIVGPQGPEHFSLFELEKSYTNIVCRKSTEMTTVLQLGKKLMEDIINLHQLEEKLLHLANPLGSKRKRSVASFLFGGDSSALLAQQVEQRFSKLVKNINKNLVKPTLNAERLLAQNLQTEETEIVNLHNIIEGGFFKSFWESQHAFTDFRSFILESELLINRYAIIYTGLEKFLINKMEGKEFSCEHHRILNRKQTCVKLNTLRFNVSNNKELIVQYSLVKFEQSQKTLITCEFSSYNESMVNALHNAVLDPVEASNSLKNSEQQPLRNLTPYEYFAPNTLLLTSGKKIGFSCATPRVMVLNNKSYNCINRMSYWVDKIQQLQLSPDSQELVNMQHIQSNLGSINNFNNHKSMYFYKDTLKPINPIHYQETKLSPLEKFTRHFDTPSGIWSTVGTICVIILLIPVCYIMIQVCRGVKTCGEILTNTMNICGRCFACFKAGAIIKGEENETRNERDTEYNLNDTLMYNPPFNSGIHVNPAFPIQPYSSTNENELNTSTVTTTTIVDDTADPGKGKEATPSTTVFKVTAGGHKPPAPSPHTLPVEAKPHSDIHEKMYGK